MMKLMLNEMTLIFKQEKVIYVYLKPPYRDDYCLIMTYVMIL